MTTLSFHKQTQALESAPVGKKDRQVNFRIDADIGDKLDAYAARQREKTGFAIPAGEVYRKLLVRGLKEELKDEERAEREKAEREKRDR